ncbi:MAG: phosphoribosylamine--glycine ligase [Candidatus Omnitrophota bacterium]
MKVLVVGSGGREHALIWKIAQSKRVKKIYAAPGNGGIAGLAECIPVKVEELDKLRDFAYKNKIDLTVVGPEAPLVLGIVDLFKKKGLRIFGPDRFGAQLEGSKVFTKELAKKSNIPTAKFEVFTTSSEAKAYIDKIGAPCVVKADGLAAGKGVIVARTANEAKKAVDVIMDERVFGKSGDRVIVEECLKGEEASIIVMTDGENIAAMASSQDHKRANDNDEGPNTGGMGAYSPAPIVSDEIFDTTINEIIVPTIKGLKDMGLRYSGVLYAGIMVVNGKPKLLEYNVRFGDPETQAILPRLKNDIVELMELTIDGNLNRAKLQWDKRACVCVVLASGGYPGNYEIGKEISGLKGVKKLKDRYAFHAGTKLTSKKICVTDGGRVLGITALGKGLKGAIDKTYEAVSEINFENMHYRRDIGMRALAREK